MHENPVWKLWSLDDMLKIQEESEKSEGRKPPFCGLDWTGLSELVLEMQRESLDLKGAWEMVQNKSAESKNQAWLGSVRPCTGSSGFRVEVVVGIFHCGAMLLK